LRTPDTTEEGKKKKGRGVLPLICAASTPKSKKFKTRGHPASPKRKFTGGKEGVQGRRMGKTCQKGREHMKNPTSG